MRSMRRIHMNNVGFAALGRTIIKNNRAQRPAPKRGVSLVASHKTETHYKKQVLNFYIRSRQKCKKSRNIEVHFYCI